MSILIVFVCLALNHCRHCKVMVRCIVFGGIQEAYVDMKRHISNIRVSRNVLNRRDPSAAWRKT